jgi:hypothetical protein
MSNIQRSPALALKLAPNKKLFTNSSLKHLKLLLRVNQWFRSQESINNSQTSPNKISTVLAASMKLLT